MKNNQNKIQELLIEHLLSDGSIILRLPNNIVLEIGMIRQNKNSKINPDYCCVTVMQDDRVINLDNYNLGLRYLENKDKMLVEQIDTDINGRVFKFFDVV